MTDKNKFNVIKGTKFKKKPKNNIPRMRKDLSPDCKRWWKKMITVLDSSIMHPSYGIALELLCSSLASYERVKKIIEKEGETYETTREDGALIRLMRPEVELLSTYYGDVLSGLQHFLATPLSRMKFLKLNDGILDDFKEDI